MSTPEKSKLWYSALGLGEVTNPDAPEISNELLVDSDINNNALCRKALEYLGSEYLQGRSYPRLLRYCFNHSRQSCEKTITQNGKKAPVPRHAEIKESLCELIRKQLGID